MPVATGPYLEGATRPPYWGIYLPARDRSGFTHFLSLWSQGIHGQWTGSSSNIDEFESIKSENQHSIPARYRRFAGFGRRSSERFPCRIALSPGRFCGGGLFFFVLSGYLITSLLMHETSSPGTVNFARFYARRARRLLPAIPGLSCRDLHW